MKNGHQSDTRGGCLIFKDILYYRIPNHTLFYRIPITHLPSTPLFLIRFRMEESDHDKYGRSVEDWLQNRKTVRGAQLIDCHVSSHLEPRDTDCIEKNKKQSHRVYLANLRFFFPKKKRIAPLNLFGGFLNVTSLKVKPFLAGETSYQIDFRRIIQVMPVKNSDFQKLNSICWCFFCKQEFAM